MRMTETYHNWGITVLRIAVGVTFLMHGWQKFFQFGLDGVARMLAQSGLPWPHLSAALLASAEFFGGIALVLGLLTRIAALGPAFVMFMAFATVHVKGGFFLPHGFEYVMVLFAANIALLMLGGGPLALDNLIERREQLEKMPPPLPTGI
jgi:putative oxidoreductase